MAKLVVLLVVAFPGGAGVVMDQFGLGVPFLIAAVVVLSTFPPTAAIGRYVSPMRRKSSPPFTAAGVSTEIAVE